MQISRRVHSIEYVQEHSTSSKGRARAVRYTPNALDEQVYMHPQSALAKAAPEFVAYTQIVRSAKRPYMTGKCTSPLHATILNLKRALQPPQPPFFKSGHTLPTIRQARNICGRRAVV